MCLGVKWGVELGRRLILVLVGLSIVNRGLGYVLNLCDRKGGNGGEWERFKGVWRPVGEWKCVNV